MQVLLAAGNEWATAEPIAADSGGKRRLREIVEAVEPTLGTANLLECLQAAVHLQSPDEIDRPPHRRVHRWPGQQLADRCEGAWQQLAADRDAAEFPISIEVVDCGLEATEVDNLAVSEVRATRNLIRPGEQVELAAEISNVGDVPARPRRVEWLVGDKVVQESPVGRSGAACERRKSTATLRMADAGHFRGHVPHQEPRPGAARPGELARRRSGRSAADSVCRWRNDGRSERSRRRSCSPRRWDIRTMSRSRGIPCIGRRRSRRRRWPRIRWPIIARS